jgi:hypothetical protein
MARVLFVFAHQDDEMAAISRIRFVRARGDDVACVFLTDGASRVPSHVRDAESRKALAILGVTDVRFEKSIPDGTLPEHLGEALAILETEACDEVVTLSYEGGHQDHDAAFLVSAVFAKRRGIKCWEMPLYSSYTRVMQPTGEEWHWPREISPFEFIDNLLIAFHYKSQWRTWLGLLPFVILRRKRTLEFIREAEPRRAENPPHPGRLFYERRFHYPYDRFAQFARTFLREAGRR